MARTKIVCTLGPVSRDEETLRLLAEAGMNVARLNFSHGTHKEHGETIQLVRKVSEARAKDIAILQDLCGPKVRTGPITDKFFDLRQGETFTLTTEDVPGDRERVSVSYAGLAREVSVGDRMMLADGDIELEAVQVSKTEIRTRVIVGGRLTERKGINLIGASLSVPSVTDKDREDLRYGVQQGVDLIAISFVRSADDVRLAKRLIADAGGDQPVIAKIEKHEAIGNIDEIIEVADGIMVARGDLGVDVPLERVPLLQKMLIRKANQAGKPVITATQMLRSMVDSPRPTRAEVTDVANAILDGTDAVMLSEETAVGRYPARAVAMLTRIADTAEGDEYFDGMRARDLGDAARLQDVISREAVDIADALKVRAIVCPTLSGATPRRVSRYRPRQAIIAVSPDRRVVRRLSLSWGVTAHLGDQQESTDQLVEQVEERVRRLGLVSHGDRVVFIGGSPAGVAGSTNFVRVDEIH
jgi:pyruvate kinase